MTVQLFLILDILGTAAFAVYGAYVGQRKELDIFGVCVCALASSFGGGMVREMLLHATPAFFLNPRYLYAAIAGCAFGIVSLRRAERIRPWILYANAIGLATFALLGAIRASNEGLGAIGIVSLAVLSAVGGGVIRDILIREIPEVLYRDFYATPALLLGVVYSLFPAQRPEPLFFYSLLVGAFLLRVYGMNHRIQLWRPGAPLSAVDCRWSSSSLTRLRDVSDADRDWDHFRL